MLVVRPAGPADIDALLDLAFLSGKGFTSLPEDRAVLAERLALSAQSFAREVPAQQAWYTVMLEDTETGMIEGVAGIKGAVGLDRPHFSFRVMTLAQYSSATGTRFDHQALVLVNECSGTSEVGSLFLRPRKRQGGAGSLLARARYALIGANRDLFAATIMAELRGWFDERDESPFWHGISAKFFRLPFEDADRMITATDGQFILDLAPRNPIYLELVDPAAREAIGKVHRHGARALAMLEDEGFTRSGLIDIFDGGPTVTAPRDQIRTIRNARQLPASTGDVEPAASDRLHLVATPGLATFRAIMTAARIGEDALVVPEATLAALGAKPGDALIVS